MKYKRILLLFLVILFNKIIPSFQQAIIQFPLTFGSGVYQMYINIGTIYQDFKLAIIDISSPYTHAPFSWKFYHESKTLRVVNPACIMTIENNITHGIEVSDMIQLSKKNGLTIENWRYNLIESKSNPPLVWKQRIGLAYKLASNSFISQLRDKGLISSLSFSITHSTNNKTINLNFGGIPEDVIKDKHYSKCRVNKESIEWSCSLNKIIVNNTSIVNTDYAYFGSESMFIYAPVSIYNVVYDNYIADGFKTKMCKFERNEFFDYTIFCSQEYIRNLADITFVIEYYNYQMNSSRIFECLYNNCKYLMMPNIKSNKWIIGISFIDSFETLFDYERGEIVFYSDRASNKVNNESRPKIPRYVYFVHGIILFIGILIEVLTLIKERQRIS